MVINLYERVEEAKSILGERAAHIIAEGMNIEKWDEVKLKGKSPFNHNDNTPSFMWNTKNNSFKDFSTGNNFGIVDYFKFKNNYSYLDGVRELFELVELPTDEVDYYNSDKKRENCICAKDEPENLRLEVDAYMEKRGISSKTLDYCSVKQSADGCIAYQFLDNSGKLISTKYRVARPATNKEFKWKWQDGCTNPPVLYGEDKIDVSQPLLIVEGLNDRLAVVESGFFNVVSIPGGANDFKWIDYNFDLLESISEIILWYDDDNPGKEAVKTASQRLGEHKVKTVRADENVKSKISEYFANYGVVEDKVDANNVLMACGKEAILSLIHNAKMIENPMVVPLMSVPEMQLQDIPRISTGITALDKIFYGLFENSLTILTGRAGSGKTTILNTMFVASPLEAGEKVFLYSGEIPNGILVGSVLKPLASRRHIRVFKNENAPDGYSVTFKAINRMKEFYFDSIFNYDDKNAFDTNSFSILSAMEYAYKRYGVKNFILDSLLTIDCSKEHGDDKWEKQKNFVIRVKNFTNRFPVRVALVAHSRKLGAGEKEIGLDDIGGSSDIVKVANRVFTVSKIDNDPDGYSVEVRCVKDRECGEVGRRVKMKYDRCSFRVYASDHELEKSYRWEQNSKIIYTDEERKFMVPDVVEVKKKEYESVISDIF